MADAIIKEGSRIIQEYVPGRQITLAHIIASPDSILYEKLGLDPRMDYNQSAIGITTVTPSEAAIIMADVAIKSSVVILGFVDRFSGSLIVTGTVSQVEEGLESVRSYFHDRLGYSVCEITKT